MTEQEKREKVMGELEACIDDSIAAVVPRDTVLEVIALLKAQEPRVMTLEEASNADCVWYDQINTGIRPAKVARVPHKPGTYRVMRLGDIDAWEHAYEYGEYWRCWTARPTDAQREATSWT